MAEPSDLKVAVREIIGPIVFAVVGSSFLLAVCGVMQITYFTSKFNDSKIIVCTVIWLGILDVFATINNVTALWEYVIVHFSDFGVLATSPWNINLSPLFSTLSALPVQLFLANRIRKFSTSWVLYGALVILILGPAVLGCMTSVQLQIKAAVVARATVVSVGYAWLALNVACDTILSALMVFYLWRRKTGFERTNKILSRYIQVSLQSAIPVTLCTILILVIGKTKEGTNIHTAFTLNLGRFYTITFMTSLNARIRVREIDNSYSTNSVDLQVRVPSLIRRWIMC
ncbi:hypothetical protein BDZ89DRAFT_550545 [Hymenopellis radicata]|nr:hypothetical protein BDZ89DRAFT_550545 [Hymenopellis radicata]